MKDYSKYSYSRMLQYIEKRCIELGRNNRIDYVLSMEKAETMEKMIDIYDHVFQYLAILFFGTRKVPHGWYITDTWGYNHGWLIDELNYCLNENILKWYKRQENVTDEQALKCIANLRYAKNATIIQKEILKTSSPNVDLGIRHFIHVRFSFYKLRHKIEKGYFASWEKGYYISYLRYLAFHGHILDVPEMAFCRDRGIKYDNLFEEYKIEREEERKLREERKKKQKEEQRHHEIAESFNAFNGFMNSAGDMALSFLFSLPFAFFGGIIGNMGRRR